MLSKCSKDLHSKLSSQEFMKSLLVNSLESTSNAKLLFNQMPLLNYKIFEKVDVLVSYEQEGKLIASMYITFNKWYISVAALKRLLNAYFLVPSEEIIIRDADNSCRNYEYHMLNTSISIPELIFSK